jgi:hypothetical protein
MIGEYFGGRWWLARFEQTGVGVHFHFCGKGVEGSVVDRDGGLEMYVVRIRRK